MPQTSYFDVNLIFLPYVVLKNRLLDKYVTVSVKLPQELKEKIEKLGIKLSKLLGKAIEEGLRRGEVESTKDEIMTRYIQFRASNRICRRVVQTLREDKAKKFRLVWHWQGSGKTYIMAFSAWRLFHS